MKVKPIPEKVIFVSMRQDSREPPEVNNKELRENHNFYWFKTISNFQRPAEYYNFNKLLLFDSPTCYLLNQKGARYILFNHEYISHILTAAESEVAA